MALPTTEIIEPSFFNVKKPKMLSDFSYETRIFYNEKICIFLDKIKESINF